MDNNIQHLFVYGSLHSGFKNPAYEYLSQYFELVGTANAQGALYHNGEYPIAVHSSENKSIKGELYKIKNLEEFDWAIAQLDDYEGLNVMPGEQSLYVRAVTQVDANGTALPAWVYWYNGSIENMETIDSGDVFDFFKS